MPLAAEFDEIVDDQADDWSDLYFELRLPNEMRLDEARLLMAPAQLERIPGERDRFTFHVSHAHGYGAYGPLVRSCLAKLDTANLRGELTLTRSFHGLRRNYTQGPALI